MDDSRFDELTRSFTLPSRRSLISAVGAAVLTALFTRENEDALAKRQRHKQKHEQRRPGRDDVRANGKGRKKGKRKKRRPSPLPATPACPAGQKACRGGCIANDDCCGGCGAGTTCRTGQCVKTCLEPANCPAPTRACAEATCVDGACALAPKNTGTTCRPAAGPCDVAEACNGSALDCPPNAFLPASAGCRSASCVGFSRLELGATCTGTSATCPAPTTVSCAPYRCEGPPFSCATSCFGPEDCVSTHYCVGSTCHEKKEDGQSCSSTEQCISDWCVDGVCCSSDCSDPPPPNMTRSCATGNCLTTCNEGFADCDNDFSNGCETNLMTDDLNCGGCGQICNGQCGPTEIERCLNGNCVCT